MNAVPVTTRDSRLRGMVETIPLLPGCRLRLHDFPFGEFYRMPRLPQLLDLQLVWLVDFWLYGCR